MKIPKKPLILAISVFAAVIFGACGNNLSGLGEFVTGQTLSVSVVQIERAPELRYTDFHTDLVDRDWRLLPSDDSFELVMVRLQVVNDTAVTAVLHVDRQSAELRDFIQGSYFPINVGARLFQDFRGQSEVTVHMSLGQCFDPNRAYIDRGTKVNWVNDDSVPHDVRLGGSQQESVPVSPGEIFTHIFNDNGVWEYQCGAESVSEDSSDDDSENNEENQATPSDTNAQIVVADPENLQTPPIRPKLFLNGSFELKKGKQIDGWVVFEAPQGTNFRDLLWRAGDSITITF